MPKFRKKPVVIEAEQFFRAREPWPAGVVWHDPNPSGRDEPYLAVVTLEGTMRCTDGDWIITGVKGERYPCKPDVFEATYEPAGADDGMPTTDLTPLLGGLTWVGPPFTSTCGCLWRRAKEYGDVVTEQCAEHAVKSAMSALKELAGEVAHNRLDSDSAAPQVAEICTRFGPSTVRILDKFFESEVTRIRYGKERSP